MKYIPPKRGKKKIIQPIPPTGREVLESVGNIATIYKELSDLRTNIVETVEERLDSVDELIEGAKEAINELSVARETIEATKEEAIEIIRDIKQGEPGKDGEDADEDEIVERVVARIPKVEQIDTKKLKKEILASISDRKADLKIIQESIEVDPMSVIDKIMALPEDKLKKFKLKSDNIDGLEQTIRAFHNQMGRGYLHGGGFSNIYSSGSLVTNGLTGLNFTGSGISSVVKDNATGIVTVTISGGTSGILTADNGLNLSTPTNVQLGGRLIQDTTIDGDNLYSLSQTNLINHIVTASAIQMIGASVSITGVGSATFQSPASLRIATPGVIATTAIVGQVLTLTNATTGQVEYTTISSGVTTLAPIGASPNANGATISGTTLNLEPASSAFGGVVTTGTQTFAGAKTFFALATFRNGATLTTGSALTFSNASANTYAITPPASLTNQSITLPGTPPATNGSVLTSTTAGVWSWVTASAFTTLTVGTTPIASGTVGAVLFQGAGSVLQQDASNFFWDDSNNRLGIGTNAPSTQLHVAGQSTFQTAPTNTRLFITGVDATTPRLVIDTYNAGAGGGALIHRRSRGTAASPAAVQSADTLGTFNVQGYGATAYAAASTGLLSFKAGSLFTDTSMETHLVVMTTPAASVTAAESARFTNTGLTLGVVATLLGTLNLAGNTSGTITIQPQAAAGTYNFNLPTGAGTSGQPLLSGGGGGTAMTFGTLGVGAGGTGTTTTFTAGSVIFAGASGVYSQDNANFFWNSGTASLNIGSQTPTQGRVNITALSTTAPALNLRAATSMAGEVFNVENSAGTDQFQIYTSGTSFTGISFGTAVNTPSAAMIARIRSDGAALSGVYMTNNTASASAGAQFVLATSAASNGILQLNSATNTTFAGASSYNLIQANNANMGFATNNVLRLTLTTVSLLHTLRNEESKGADVASANDLTLGTDGNTFGITGTTTINAITTANWQAGSVIRLIFAGALTVKHNTAGGAGTARIFLNGSVDLTTAANTILTLVYDGTQFQETARKVA